MTTTKIQYGLLLILLIPCWIIAYHFDIDLVNLHVAAGFTHTDLSRVYAQNGSYGRWFYPPFSLVLIHPLGALPYGIVKGFWIVLQTVAYGCFWYGLYTLYPQLRQKGFAAAWILVFIIAINPIHNNFQSNNVQLMLMAVLVMAELLSSKEGRSQVLSGVLVSFATWFKVFPVFMAAYYFLFKPVKVKAGVVVGFLIGLALPLAFFGWDAGLTLYKDFYSGVTTYGRENSLSQTPDIMCLPSLLDRVFTYLIPVAPQTIALLTKVLTLVISIGFFGWAYFSKRSIHVWALALALTVFLNPSTRPHYFIFYVPAFVSLLTLVWKKRSVWNLGGIVLSVVLIAFTTDAVVGKGLNDRLEFLSLPTIGSALATFLLFYFLFRDRFNDRRITGADGSVGGAHAHGG